MKNVRDYNVGMVGQTFTRQISQVSSDQLLKYINVTE